MKSHFEEAMRLRNLNENKISLSIVFGIEMTGGIFHMFLLFNSRFLQSF